MDVFIQNFDEKILQTITMSLFFLDYHKNDPKGLAFSFGFNAEVLLTSTMVASDKFTESGEFLPWNISFFFGISAKLF